MCPHVLGPVCWSGFALPHVVLTSRLQGLYGACACCTHAYGAWNAGVICVLATVTVATSQFSEMAWHPSLYWRWICVLADG